MSDGAIEMSGLLKSGLLRQSFATRFLFLEVLAVSILASVYLSHGRLVEPLNTVAELPEAVSGRVLFEIHESADAVLLALGPPAMVFASVRPRVEAESILLVILVFAVVTHTTRVEINTEAVHEAVCPLAVVRASVSPKVGTKAVHFVCDPIAVVG